MSKDFYQCAVIFGPPPVHFQSCSWFQSHCFFFFAFKCKCVQRVQTAITSSAVTGKWTKSLLASCDRVPHRPTDRQKDRCEKQRGASRHCNISFVFVSWVRVWSGRQLWLPPLDRVEQQTVTHRQKWKQTLCLHDPTFSWHFWIILKPCRNTGAGGNKKECSQGQNQSCSWQFCHLVMWFNWCLKPSVRYKVPFIVFVYFRIKNLWIGNRGMWGQQLQAVNTALTYFELNWNELVCQQAFIWTFSGDIASTISD